MGDIKLPAVSTMVVQLITLLFAPWGIFSLTLGGAPTVLHQNFLTDKSEKDKYYITYMWIKKAKLINTESKMVITKGWGIGGKDRCCLKVLTYNE